MKRECIQCGAALGPGRAQLCHGCLAHEIDAGVRWLDPATTTGGLTAGDRRTIRALTGAARPKLNAWQWGHADGVRDFAETVRDWLLWERWTDPYGLLAVGADWHLTTAAERHIAGELSSPTWRDAPLYKGKTGGVMPIPPVCQWSDGDRLSRVRLIRNACLLSDWYRVLYVCPRGLAYAARVRDAVRADPRSWTRDDVRWLDPPKPGERVRMDNGTTTTAGRLLAAFAFAVDESDALAAYRLSGHTPDDGPLVSDRRGWFDGVHPTPQAVERARRRFVENTHIELIHLRKDSRRGMSDTPSGLQDDRDAVLSGRHYPPTRRDLGLTRGTWNELVGLGPLGPGLDGGSVARLTLEDIAANATTDDDTLTADDILGGILADHDTIVRATRGGTPFDARWVAENGTCPACGALWDFDRGDRCTGKRCRLRIAPDRLVAAGAKKLAKKSG